MKPAPFGLPQDQAGKFARLELQRLFPEQLRFIATDNKEREAQPFLLFVTASADKTSPHRTNPDDAALSPMKVTRAEYDAKVQKMQANQLAQLTSAPGGAYRVTLYDLPGFTHRSFTDQTLFPTLVDPKQPPQFSSGRILYSGLLR